MKIRCAALLSLICLAWSTPASAQWRVWGRYQGTPVYFQKLERKRSTVLVWVRRQSVIGRLQFDCSQSTVRQLAAVKNGQPFDAWGEYYSVKPKTFGGWLYGKACP